MNKSLLTLMLLLPMLSISSSGSSGANSRSSTPAAQAESLELKKDHFTALLQSIPYPEFRDLICSGHYIDKTDWLFHFLEIQLSKTIFQRNEHGSLNPEKFTDSFQNSELIDKDPNDWLDKQIKDYINDFHAACYEIFTQRAIHEITQNAMPWTNAVSIPDIDKNGTESVPHDHHLYPIYYASGTYVAVHKYPPLDKIHIVIADILSNLLTSKEYKKLLNLQPLCEVSLYATYITTPYAYTNDLLSTKFFDQEASEYLSSAYSQLQGKYLQYRLPDGSLITCDRDRLYYHQYNPTNDSLELYDTCKYDRDQISGIYLTNQSTLCAHYFNELSKTYEFYSWDLKNKNSQPQLKPMIITNIQEMKKSSLPNLLLNEKTHWKNSNQFSIGIAESEKTKDIIYIFKKTADQPEQLTFITTLPPIAPFQSDINLHQNSNRLAVINHDENSFVVYQLNNDQKPTMLKWSAYPKAIQGDAQNLTGQSIRRIHWSPSGALLAVLLNSQQVKSMAHIQIFNSSTWEEIYHFYSNHDDPQVEFSPDDQYCLYTQSRSESVPTYAIQDLINKEKLLSLKTDSKIPMELHWSLNPTKNQLLGLAQSLQEKYLGIIWDVNPIIDKVVPSLIESTISKYLFSLGQPATAKAPTRINVTRTTTYLEEQARYNQENYEYKKMLSDNNDYAYTAKQCFLLGQLFFENKAQAFNELGGVDWLNKQPQDMQKLVQRSLQQATKPTAKSSIPFISRPTSTAQLFKGTINPTVTKTVSP